jgi:pimeloyl-ACP methyl ester carboxylesterase
VPHTMINWHEGSTDGTSAPISTTGTYTSNGDTGELEMDSSVAHTAGLQQCEFLPSHKGTFDPTLLSSHPHSSSLLLRKYTVLPQARIGNGWSDPKRVRANFVWMGDIPVGVTHAAHLAHALRGMGVAFHAVEHRGFGESEGPRGCMEWQTALEDQLAFINHVRVTHTATDGTTLPLFLAGLGFGGTLALLAAVRLGVKQVAGLFMMSPATTPREIHGPSVGKDCEHEHA